jgi:hypothetical protein
VDGPTRCNQLSRDLFMSATQAEVRHIPDGYAVIQVIQIDAIAALAGAVDR